MVGRARRGLAQRYVSVGVVVVGCRVARPVGVGALEAIPRLAKNAAMIAFLLPSVTWQG